MGAIRTMGLLFFLAILVGGCILANTSPAIDPPEPPNAQEVSWEEFVQILHEGHVVNVLQADDLTVYSLLQDGTVILSKAPFSGAMYQEAVRCGQRCSWIQSESA